MTAIRKFWHRIAAFFNAHARKTPQAHAFESELSHQRDEIDRLRAENRALLNSILGIAGIPPIPIQTFTPPSPAVRHSESPTHSRGDDESLARPASSPHKPAAEGDSASRQSAARNDSPISPSPHSQSRAATPLRRRSWHQINRILEIESARKPKDQGRGEKIDA